MRNSMDFRGRHRIREGGFRSGVDACKRQRMSRRRSSKTAGSRLQTFAQVRFRPPASAQSTIDSQRQLSRRTTGNRLSGHGYQSVRNNRRFSEPALGALLHDVGSRRVRISFALDNPVSDKPPSREQRSYRYGIRQSWIRALVQPPATVSSGEPPTRSALPHSQLHTDCRWI